MLLALDTSGPFCSAAIAGEGRILAVRSEEIGRGHAEHLMPMLEELLRDSKATWTDINKIACTTGPGSFTGLRVSLATARGLSLALDCVCVGVSVFEAFAAVNLEEKNNQPFAVVMDAKRNQLWLQLFDENSKPAGDPLALSPEEANSHIPEKVSNLFGSGAPILADLTARFVVKNNSPSPPIEGVVQFALSGKSNTTKPKPLYMRKPDAKPQKPALLRP